MTKTLFVVLILSVLKLSSAQSYSLQANRLNNGMPIINSLNPQGSSGSSIFKYNYNVAYVPQYDGLMVRCQDTKGTDPYKVAPSEIAYAQLIGTGGSWKLNLSNIEVDPITEQSIVIEPTGPSTSYGTEDPRISLDKKTGIYYLMYSAVENTTDGAAISRLALRTSPTPFIQSSWTNWGPIFPDIKWSKSGALHIVPGDTSYLYWGDSTIEPGIQVATTQNLVNYTYYPEIFIHIRNESFDSALVEAGPTPLPLSDGNLLFIYNSARPGYPSSKPGWDLQYNVGWVIINGSNPLQILQRSEEPLLSPELDWEIGLPPYLGLTPNVVFVEGWDHGTRPDTFIIFYGAADSSVGVAEVVVEISNDDSKNVWIN